MRSWFTGLVVSLLLIIATLVAIIPLMLLALLKLLPVPPLRRSCSLGLSQLAQGWAACGQVIFARLTPTRWDIRGVDALRRDRSYLIVSNHQSWVDIPALLQALNGRTPFFRFFIKRELVWVPFLGLAFWALDYPFMKRYSSARLAREPHLRGADLAITRRACEKFRTQPVSVVNYLEGTRFTPAKQAQQDSPYRYLLRPKAGGVAHVLAALGDQLDAVIDVTVVYCDGHVPGFWELLSGQVSRVIVDVRLRELDPQLCQGDYQHDAAFRQRIQDWVNLLWAEKDARIEQLSQEVAQGPAERRA